MAGRVGIISGAARGMGAETARVLVREGASIVIGDVLEDEGRAVAAEIGDGATFVPLDVTLLNSGRPPSRPRCRRTATSTPWSTTPA